MDPQCNNHSSSLSCALRIINARNIDTKLSGGLFVRCYLSAGNNTRVKLESREISSKSDLTWNQTFSLDCSGAENSIEWLKQDQTLVLELRLRSSETFLSRINGLKLVGKAEFPWKIVFESEKMEIERWVQMIPENNAIVPPAVKIAMKIQESGESATKRKKMERRCDKECGCMDCGYDNSCVDYEYLAIGAALEAL